MKTILKYLAIFAVLMVPVILFPQKVSIWLAEYPLTVLVISCIILTKWLWWAESDFKQYTTWIVSFFVGLVPWLFNFGILEDAKLIELPIFALVFGLVANGLYNLSWVKKILKWLGLLPNYVTK